ncbi:MAG: cell division protein FtsA [Burkholderiales bacterium]|nr:cell division protein FtsA [Burkholderiales bacterium]
MKSQMIYSLDIGSSKIVALVGSINKDGFEIHGISNYYYVTNNKVNDFACINNGVICDLEVIVQKSQQVLDEARIKADCSFGGVILNFAGASLLNKYSNYEISLNNQSVTADIIQKLIDTAKQINYPSSYEILDFEVQEYVLDNENYTINPIHLTAAKIQSNINLFFGNVGQINNLKNVMRYTSYELAKIVPAGILSGLAVLNHEEKELGCCLIDIGAGTTDVVIYENGFIRYLCSIPFGGETITRDVAAALKISRNLAEDIKLKYGSLRYANGGTVTHKFNEGISITDHRGINTSVSRKLLIDVISKRVKDILSTVKSTLIDKKIYDIIKSGIVITGGSSALVSLEDFAKQTFDLPTRIGVPNYSGNFSEIIMSPKYSTSIGALYFAQQYMQNEINNTYNKSSNGVLGKLKKIFK